MYLSVPTHLSFSKTLSSQNSFFPFKFPQFSLTILPVVGRKTTIIRMGGGPRTYPGGVSKWQWKRMQAKKAKQLLKARLARERQIYEMRKRAELKAAVSELERPWEVVERAPTLFSVKADEQVKVLADRFQKPGGFDMWSERDGPQLFETPHGFPSARFFPKGVVHSLKPYRVISDNEDEKLDSDLDGEIESESENELISSVGREMRKHNNNRNGVPVNGKLRSGALHIERKNNGMELTGMEENSDSQSESGSNTKSRSRNGGKFLKQGNKNNRFRGNLGSLNSEQAGLGRKQKRDGAFIAGGDTKTDRSKIDYRTGRRSVNDSGNGGSNRKRNGAFIAGGDAKTDRSKIDYRTGRRSVNDSGNGGSNRKRNLRNSKSEVYDMDLQKDGSYVFEAKTRQFRSQNPGN